MIRPLFSLFLNEGIDPFDGYYSALDSTHETFIGEYLTLFDSRGNERYWIRNWGGEECAFAAFTWASQAFSNEAADFLLNEVLWVDVHPSYFYYVGSIVPLWAFLLSGPA